MKKYYIIHMKKKYIKIDIKINLIYKVKIKTWKNIFKKLFKTRN